MDKEELQIERPINLMNFFRKLFGGKAASRNASAESKLNMSIALAGVRRDLDEGNNDRKIMAAFADFKERFPNTAISVPRPIRIGRFSQNIGFFVRAPFSEAQPMQAFFKEAIHRHGLPPLGDAEQTTDADAVAQSLSSVGEASPAPRMLLGDEVRMLEGRRKLGTAICQHYLDHCKSTTRDLDAAYAAWVIDKHPKRPDEREITYGLGTLLGDILAREMGFHWCIFTSGGSGDAYTLLHESSNRRFEPYPFVITQIKEKRSNGFFGRQVELFRS